MEKESDNAGGFEHGKGRKKYLYNTERRKQISDIILSNSGEELLAIEDVSVSCGCITVEYLKEPIRPGQKLNLRIKYKAEHPEHFDKTVIIYCNAEGSPFRLKISGNAK